CRGGLGARDQSEGVRLLVRRGQRVLARGGGLGVQRCGRAGAVAVRADLGQDRGSELLGLGSAHHDDGGGTVGDLRGGACRDRAVPVKSRAQLGQGLHGGVRTYPFVVREHDRVTLASGDLDGDDLVVEESLFGRGGCPLVGARGKGVLLGASDTELAVVTLGGSTHRVTLEGVGETIVRGGVENLDRAVLVALAGLGQQV